MESRRVNIKAILADADLRRKLMVSTIQATQAREGIDTSPEQADRAYQVVTEAERATFFALEQFRAIKGRGERRHEEFVRALRSASSPTRMDVARRDFASISGAPLAYQRVGIVAHLFRDLPALEPSHAVAKQGLATSDDARWIRTWWEVPQTEIGRQERWVPLSKGGDFARFYYSYDLVIKWADNGRELKAFIVEKDGSETKRIYSQEWYFRAGISWPRRTAKGLNTRRLPAGSIFSDKGPAIFAKEVAHEDYILGVTNSAFFEYLFRSKTSFSWEVGVMKSMPVPPYSEKQATEIGALARTIHDLKAEWDVGNEISWIFSRPWILGSCVDSVALATALERMLETEARNEAILLAHYCRLNDAIYGLYAIPGATRKTIEDTLGERPPEILWPQMEGKSVDQKRMEHVWRLLSYAVKRVLEADDDGVVSFNAVNGEPRLVERVRHELATLFPGRDANQVEVEIDNELKKTVKGYRKCASLDEWLNNAYFEYHCGLYKSRPIFWHIASTQGTARFAFGALVHYHRFDKNRMAKLRANYLRDAIEEFRREAGLADKAGRSDDRLELQAKVEEAQALDKKLQLIQEGHHEGADGGERDYRILTPWKKPGARPKGWDPDLDDGVKVNIEPFEKAGVLRVSKVT
jgi:hypothetical protein